MHRNRARQAARVLVPFFLAASALSGCVSNPYANSVSEVDEEHLPQPAATQVSEPQLCARETLINDRRREAEYLEELIKKSDGVYFEPQLKRVVQSYQALRGSVEGGYALRH